MPLAAARQSWFARLFQRLRSWLSGYPLPSTSHAWVLADAIGLPVLGVQQGVIAYANAAARRQFGYTSLAGQPVTLLLPDYAQLAPAAPDDPTTPLRLEARPRPNAQLRRGDGQLIPVFVTIGQASFAPALQVVTIHDLTAAVAAEERRLFLREARDLLAQASEYTTTLRANRRPPYPLFCHLLCPPRAPG
ncbi:MAG: hypothetical protein KatS3mg061_2946 [Dehalococcoidia bacterium]|nr:MAG: hypothetical protein KatS3mg061_2946 [Dehalococcoidia bacterium]